jgi:acyl-CoA hydrolase
MATDTGMDIEHMVTEYGTVNLQGESTRERALALICWCKGSLPDRVVRKIHTPPGR